jgi:SAM-dependent methyltransferase
LPRDVRDLFVLEIGCGAGGILEYFREVGCTVKGLDLDEEYVTFGRTEYRLDLSVATLATTEVGRSTDLVIYAHTLEHILRPVEELNEVSRRLSDGGLLYIEVPGVKNLARDYQMDFLRMLQNAHTYHFSLTTLTNLLRLSGFALVVGDESIRAVFRRATLADRNTESTKAVFFNDYDPVRVYLYGIEKRRNQLRHKLWAVWRSGLIRTLRILRLYEMARTVYLELTK